MEQYPGKFEHGDLRHGFPVSVVQIDGIEIDQQMLDENSKICLISFVVSTIFSLHM